MKVLNFNYLHKIVKFKKIIFLNVIIFFTVYFLDFFYLFPENVRCVTLGKIYFPKLSYIFPVHCDEKFYFTGVQSLESFFEYGYPYQKRPLWILTLKVTSLIVDYLTFYRLSAITVFRLSVIFVQFLITNILSFQLLKLLNIKDNKQFYFLISLLLIPSVRWNFFVPSNENLTLLALLIVLNHIKLKGFSNSKNIYYLLGFLALFHRSFIFYGIFLIAYKSFKQNDYLSIIYKIFQICFFTIIYEISIFFSPFKSYDYNKEVYVQFYWFFYRLFNIPKDTKFGGEFCQTGGTFLICYFKNTIEFLIFYAPFILIFTVLMIRFRSLIELKEIKNLFYLTMFIYLIWSFQGWYPPFRFINYSLGYFFIISIYYFISLINEKNWLIFSSLYLVQTSYYFMGLYSGEHTFLNFNTLLSILLLLIFILFAGIQKKD